MPLSTLQILVIGVGVTVVVAFTAGYLIGSRPTVASPCVQNNYDPAKAVCESAIREAIASGERCWQMLVEAKRREVKP
jgi:hypothetical protein